MEIKPKIRIIEFKKDGFIVFGFRKSRSGGWNAKYSDGRRLFYYYIDIIILNIDFEFCITFQKIEMYNLLK